MSDRALLRVQVGERSGVRAVVGGLAAAGGRLRVPAANLLSLLLAHPREAPHALALLQACPCAPAPKC